MKTIYSLASLFLLGTSAFPVEQNSILSKRYASSVNDGTIALLKSVEGFGKGGNFYTIDGDVTIGELLETTSHATADHKQVMGMTALNARTALASKLLLPKSRVSSYSRPIFPPTNLVSALCPTPRS